MATTKTRTRVLRAHERREGVKSKLFPFLDFEDKTTGTLSSTQVTVSEGHPFPKRGSNEDLGGEFLTTRASYKDNCRRFKVWSGTVGDSAYFDGTLFPYIASSTVPIEELLPMLRSDDTDLDALGATAIARVLPTNPVAGLATFFGELREGFPRAIGSSLFREQGKSVAKRASDEYLNFQFGWAPMVRDFNRWLDAVRSADRIWKQFQRDAGRRVRRRYYFPGTTVVESAALANQPIAGGSANTTLWQGGIGSSQSTLYTHTEIKRERWFSGAFTYYLADNPQNVKAWDRDMQRLEKLYGVKVTPEVIWNLVPWSWATDWFANTGDILHNVSRFAQDGLVMPYGYMMEQSTMTATYRMRDVTPKGMHIPDLTQVLSKTVKYRRPATPFGFGLDVDSFSPFQLSIIAALGLSRRK